MLAHASLLCMSIRATLFDLRTENVHYAFMERPTKRNVSKLYLGIFITQEARYA